MCGRHYLVKARGKSVRGFFLHGLLSHEEALLRESDMVEIATAESLKYAAVSASEKLSCPCCKPASRLYITWYAALGPHGEHLLARCPWASCYLFAVAYLRPSLKGRFKHC